MAVKIIKREILQILSSVEDSRGNILSQNVISETYQDEIIEEHYSMLSALDDEVATDAKDYN